MTAQWLNTIGLVLGMAGVVLIFIWGPPQPNFDEDVGLVLMPSTRLQSGRTAAEVAQDARRLRRRYQFWSRLGLFLIGVGFAVQLLAVWA